MPTIVYFVHGMGCGTATGSPDPSSSWTDSIKDVTKWMTTTFGLQKTTWVDGIPSSPPSADPDAIWFVPVSYHDVFDDFRRDAAGREALKVQATVAQISDAQITRLTSAPFLWTNCLDVLLWAMDTAITQRQVMTTVLNTITAVDALARRLKKGTVRRILVSHSLGTAVATAALHNLGNSPDWIAMGGFDLVVTLANVAPFLFPDDADIYGPPLIPASMRSITQVLLNVRNDADPIPWLLPWRAWNIPRSGPFAAEWQNSASLSRCKTLATSGVAALESWSPEITQVHGFANYMMAPGTAEFLAGMIRGALFTPAELSALQWPAKWTTLNRLSCIENPAQLQNLTRDVVQIQGQAFPGTGTPTSGWFDRLLNAADMLVKARAQC